ncbi:hypothetical protein OSB04_010877 [Centaurea solstitialis]|uniref:DDE Tnp4 domain-containing protein n=1 Tax=Centaurea solstitialis TaxID=347529 RepID=A0AA38TFZ4_9ASTR|nr:hypothetical protein OSB04_010877 [Centaurea solstitialis]
MLLLVLAAYYAIMCSYIRYKIREIKTKDEKIIDQMKWMFRLTMESDNVFISEFRMDRATFRRLFTPPSDEKARYRTKKGCISTNVLGVCCPNMQFIYVLPGWEGSAHDGRSYYLVDFGYCNANGFLAPYRGQRYNLKEFSGHRPNTVEEYFNMKHSKARDVFERCFGLLKGRWKILASPSFFSIETQVRIIMACCLLHNLNRKFMSHDPQKMVLEEEEEEPNSEDESDEVEICYNEPTKVKVFFTLPTHMRRSDVLGFLYPVNQ